MKLDYVLKENVFEENAFVFCIRENVYKGCLYFSAQGKQEEWDPDNLQNVAWNNLRTWPSVPVLIIPGEI